MEGIYLDNNATTKIDDRVFVTMCPYLTNHFAHPSSLHPLGTKVREKIEQARDSVAVLLGTSHTDEIVFTSVPFGIVTGWYKRMRAKWERSF